jgi:hypothetical protein
MRLALSEGLGIWNTTKADSGGQGNSYVISMADQSLEWMKIRTGIKQKEALCGAL